MIAKDGTALSVNVVHARVEGTVLNITGTSATVINRDGLHVTLDLSSTTDTITVGEQVDAGGTASADGLSIVVGSVTADTE